MIPAELARSNRTKRSGALAVERTQDIRKAGAQIAAIYNENAFPELKVTWGTYPNNLGHTIPGMLSLS